MHEGYSRQALPSKKYRELLGAALCVFNSNNAFVIENILKIDRENYSWYDLINKESGKLKPDIAKTISEYNNEIYNLFDEIVGIRNRIVHSFQITKNGEQILHTKDKNNKQYDITESYLMDFIKKNGLLSDKLYVLREELRSREKTIYN